MSGFVHLHVHTEYSLREGALRIRDLVRRAAEYGMPAVAVTDTLALYGAVSFYVEAKAAGIRPIVGVQMQVAKAPLAEDPGPGRRNMAPALDTAVLLAEDFTGYQQLVRLVTKARSRERLPCVTLDELADHAAHVVALIGGGESRVLRAFSAGDEAEAETWLDLWMERWPKGALYVDIQDHGLPEERRGLPGLVKSARRRGLPMVATNDVHYLEPADAELQRVLAQIEGAEGARGLQGERYHFASAEEMARRFVHLPEALANTALVAERCRLELPLGQVLLPRYPTPDGEQAAAVLRRAAEAGARQRYGDLPPAVRERLDYELSVIERMGFADYFLVVADFIRYAHKQGIATGPGRGSAAGSLVAYALRITDVDPIRHHLLFERFLNPERVSWPDIDTDFEYERRMEVIQYVVARYGADKVAQIGTFGTLAARAAVRDAGRVLGADKGLVDQLAKLIPGQPGMTLAKAMAEVPAVSQFLDRHPPLRALWDTAVRLEGFPRHTSVHAAGVVISPVPLTDLVPVEPGADGIPVTQYAMEDIERLGLVKMDFLGLRTLTLIDHCAASVARRTGRAIDWRKVPEDDPKTYAMLARGEADGCFQLESPGMRRVLREVQPANLEDIAAVISLYRPGPMEHIPEFVAAKHGRAPIRYPHPDLEPILRDTYGVIVYQEQIMQIAARMAGFSLGEADLLRRAVSKKKREVLDQERSRFVAGCLARGYDEAVANEVYDLIVRFADYGFNRSHAAAYAVLAYRTAYLRANHLPDFLAGLLSMSIASPDKLRAYERDARQHGIRILPPDVQHSEALYVVEADDAIRTGLLAVRNVGRAAVDAILAARREAPFRSLVDFVERVNPRMCNRKAVESLLAAGALAGLLPGGMSRQAALHALDEAYAAAEGARLAAGLLLDDAAPAPAPAPSPPQVLYIRYAAGEGARQALWRVRQVLGMYPGETRVALYDGSKRRLRVLEPRWSVSPQPELISALEEIVGLGNARLGPWPRSPRGV
ncbi:DNA-directed DNA polymerase [Alicyclobacillus cellulosilyticus]|uniref:DNA-directed DNA polymerase n=1 Tax=Alicyclobacillus cellulosilyticus TaxID=1003997 RepID=A0A917KET6_9BACL|nr:DNA-directed DNA polymerase [Alicyclobacillus cellulosilyticus]